MFGMKGFHVLASGAIQGHHDPLVFVAFREEFTRISIFLNSASSPHTPLPCLLTNNFEKCHPRNISMTLFRNLTRGFIREEFWRISLKSTRAKSLPPRWPCFSTDHNFANSFWKGSHKEQSCEIIPNSDLRFRGRRFLAPLAVGHRAYVMVRCPSCVSASVRASVR